MATIASPFKGSFEAIVKLTVGTGNLGKGKPSHAERRSARVTPALYQLLPAFKRGLNIDRAFPQTLFDAASWQPSLLASLTKYVRKTGLPEKRRRATARRRCSIACSRWQRTTPRLSTRSTLPSMA